MGALLHSTADLLHCASSVQKIAKQKCRKGRTLESVLPFDLDLDEAYLEAFAALDALAAFAGAAAVGTARTSVLRRALRRLL